MEDLDSEEVRQWIKAQNDLTFSFLEKSPLLEKIRTRMTELWNYEKYSPPTKRGDRYFFSYNNGLQNQNVLYWTENLDEDLMCCLTPIPSLKTGRWR